MKIHVSATHKDLEFYVETEFEDDEIHYYIGNPEKRHAACVHIIVGDKETHLHGIGYAKTCNTMKNLEEGADTIAMVQGALKYVLQKHPNITNFDVLDDAYKVLRPSGKKILITPRRLIIGKQGWYQEYFGAIPKGRTVKLMKHFSNKSNNINEKEALNWGSYQEIYQVASKILPVPKDLFHTEWSINNKVIRSYPVKITEIMEGGSIRIKEYVQKRSNRPPAFIAGSRI